LLLFFARVHTTATIKVSSGEMVLNQLSLSPGELR
jgi:hypothetical protein